MKFFCITIKGHRGIPHRFDNVMGMGYSGTCIQFGHKDVAEQYKIPRQLAQALYLTLAEAQGVLKKVYSWLYEKKSPRVEVFDWPDEPTSVEPRQLTPGELEQRCPDSCANCAFHCADYKGTYMFSGDSWGGNLCALEPRTARSKNQASWTDTICPFYRDDRKASRALTKADE